MCAAALVALTYSNIYFSGFFLWFSSSVCGMGLRCCNKFEWGFLGLQKREGLALRDFWVLFLVMMVTLGEEDIKAAFLRSGRFCTPLYTIARCKCEI